MDSEVREELEEIINDVREYKERRAESMRRIEEIDEEIEELTKSKYPFEDEIEGYDDDIKGATARFMSLLEDLTDPAEVMQYSL